ncbi:MAG TPA: lipocalin-like domain-containing protein [Xanthobacteraceae bacterium]|jgi:hypothetical protein
MKRAVERSVAVLMTQLYLLCFLAIPAAAQDREKLLGNWKLVSFYTEDVQSKQRNDLYGAHPNGHIGFTPDGRFFALVAADGRKPPQTPDDQAAAFRSMIAYTGKYRLEGDKFITKVDVAWNEGWTGTEQVRFWRVEAGKLYITTAPIPNPNVPGGMVIGTLVWEKE